ncbi:MAG TPA: Sjogren's syndrome/scleroderma autoantigen 1 family protein [Methanoregulaceae archaeon]|nr:Sjogren's syndrome/scleroderma autoantigen 1 family protein [Methanoregulaceae archaeon]
MKREDEIMAEYLLKGGKMLAKTCSSCGCPLFEYNGRTFCVVCEQGTQPVKDEGKTEDTSASEKNQVISEEKTFPNQGVKGALEETIIALCARMRQEPDPERVLLLMTSVKKGIDALKQVS